MSEPSLQKESSTKSKKNPLDPAIIVAVITLVGTIMTGILASPVLIAWIQREPESKSLDAKLNVTTPPSSQKATVIETAPSDEVSSADNETSPSSSSVSAINVACIQVHGSDLIKVDAESLRVGGGSSLSFANGQRISLSKVKSLEIVDVRKTPPPVILVDSITVAITTVDGSSITGTLDKSLGHMHGSTELGGFMQSLDKIQSVTFEAEGNC